MGPDGELLPDKRRLCRGYSDEVQRRHEAGEYAGIDADPEELRATVRALRALIRFEDGIKAKQDGACIEAITLLDKRSMRLLSAVFKGGLFK